MLRRLFVLSLLIASGCAENSANLDFDRDPENDTDNTGVDDTDGALDYAGPTYWGVRGALEVVDGGVDVTASTLTATFYDALGHPWQNPDLQGPGCTLDVLEAVGGPVVADDDTSMIGWWQLSLDPDTELPCPWPIPTAEAAGTSEAPQVILGLGELDVRLTAAMTAADLEPSLPVYGLYTLHPASGGDRLYVFGVGGTQAQFEGTDTPRDVPPPADGSYALHTLLLLPIPEASRN